MPVCKSDQALVEICPVRCLYDASMTNDGSKERVGDPRMFPLAEHRFFILSVLVESGTKIAFCPMSSAVRPGTAMRYAEGKREEIIKVYDDVTKWFCVVGRASGITIGHLEKPCFPKITNL